MQLSIRKYNENKKLALRLHFRLFTFVFVYEDLVYKRYDQRDTSDENSWIHSLYTSGASVVFLAVEG
jgi:hypothetical protein